MNTSLTPEQWIEVDPHIFNGRILRAVKAIRKFTGVGSKEAVDISHNRYLLLRATRSSEFKCTEEEYWRWYYS